MEANTEAKRTPAELISLDHYQGCQYCSDPDRGFCAEGDRLEQACIAAGQVCPNCDSMSEDGGLCWYCHDEQKATKVYAECAICLRHVHVEAKQLVRHGPDPRGGFFCPGSYQLPQDTAVMAQFGIGR